MGAVGMEGEGEGEGEERAREDQGDVGGRGRDCV